MKNRDVKQIDRYLTSIKLKEKNGISADKDYMISEDTYDDIVMLAVVCAHLAADAEIEYDYSDFKWISSFV